LFLSICEETRLKNILNLFAIDILEKNNDKIDSYVLLKNPNAMMLLEKNINKKDWNALLRNPSIRRINKKHYNPSIIKRYLNHHEGNLFFKYFFIKKMKNILNRYFKYFNVIILQCIN